MSKFLGGLLGTCVIVCLLLLAYYLRWSAGADIYLEQTQANLKHYQQQFNSGLGATKVTIAHDGVDVTGFPFSKRVRIYRPSVRVETMTEIFYVDVAVVELKPEDETGRRFSVNYGSDINAGYKKGNAPQESYNVHVLDVPQLWLQVAEHNKATDARWGEYGVAFQSNKLTLDASNGQKSEQIVFPTLSTQMPLWGNIPRHVHYPVQVFVGMLREALVYR